MNTTIIEPANQSTFELTEQQFEFTPTSLKVIGSPTYEDWEAIGQQLGYIEGAVHWWIGDWANYGEHHWGEMYAQAIDETGFAYQTIADDKWVAGQVNFSCRQEKLSFKHHVAIAPLEPEQQKYWLDKAEEEGWSASKLRNEIRASKQQRLLDEQIDPDIQPDDSIILGDCTQVIWPSGVDLIIADPPFGLTVGDSSGVRDGKGDWDEKDYQTLHAFNQAWLNLAVESLREGGSIFVFGTVHNIFSIGHILKDLDCYIVRDIVWNKPFVQRQVNLYSLVPSHELIIWARKGDEHTCNLAEIMRDVWEIQPAAKYGHPTEKPETLIKKIIELASNPGELVIDPFLGSGTTTAIAKQLKRYYWGVELDEQWWNIATERTRKTEIL